MPTTQIKLGKPMPIQTASNVPMPTPRGRYPFKLLEIGDSFAVPIAEVDRANAAAQYYGKTSDTQLRRFTRRRDQKAGIVRYWRVS